MKLEASDYLRIFWKRRIVFAVLVVICAGLSVAVIATSPRRYTASAEMFVATQSGTSANDLDQASAFTQDTIQSYAAIVATPAVLNTVAARLHVPGGEPKLAHDVSATAASGTVLVTISVTADSAARAASLANAVGASFAVVAPSLELPSQTGTSAIRITRVSPARPPATPSSPDKRIDLAFGVLAGVLLGMLAALLRESLDTRLRTAKELADATGVPVLGTISFDAAARGHGFTMISHQSSVQGEAYRQLRTTLKFLDINRPVKSILVTSAVTGEGKTTTAANLAISLSETGATVVFVDADFRRPSDMSHFGLSPPTNGGVTTVLIGQASAETMVRPWRGEQLFVLPAGPSPPNPSELLGSDAMRVLLARLNSHFDFVVIDTPPLLPVTDAAVLTPYVDGVILVAGWGVVRRDEVQRAAHQLHDIQARLLGTVLNRVPVRQARADGYYSEYGSSSVHARADPQDAQRAGR
jgi:capsular exopolysaccharide synthesis family protein